MASGLPGVIQESAPTPTYEGKWLIKQRLKHGPFPPSRQIPAKVIARPPKRQAPQPNSHVPLRNKQSKTFHSERGQLRITPKPINHPKDLFVQQLLSSEKSGAKARQRSRLRPNTQRRLGSLCRYRTCWGRHCSQLPLDVSELLWKDLPQNEEWTRQSCAD